MSESKNQDKVSNGSKEGVESGERPNQLLVKETTEPREGCKLFIAQLDFGTQDETLHEAFSKFGRIVDYHIARQGTVSRGYGFVTYDDPRDAEDAMDSMNRKVFDGREIKIQIAEDRKPDGDFNNHDQSEKATAKLFVGGLAWEVTSKVLGETFQDLGVGDVEEARIVMDKTTGRSRGFGFVTMTSIDAAIAAQTKLNGKDIGGRPVKVDFDHTDSLPPKRYSDYRDNGGGSGGHGYQDDYRGGKGKGKGDHRYDSMGGYGDLVERRDYRGRGGRGDEMPPPPRGGGGYGRDEYREYDQRNYREGTFRYDDHDNGYQRGGKGGKGDGYGAHEYNRRPIGGYDQRGGAPFDRRDDHRGGKGYQGKGAYEGYRGEQHRDTYVPPVDYRDVEYGRGGPRLSRYPPHNDFEHGYSAELRRRGSYDERGERPRY